MDATTSDGDLKEVRKLINNAVKPYNIENGDTQVGLVSFGTKAEAIVKFPGVDKDGFSLAVDLVEHKRGERNIIQALQSIKGSFFQPSALRQNSRKLIVLFINAARPISDLQAFESTLKSLNDSDIGFAIVLVSGSKMLAAELRKSSGRYGRILQGVINADLPDSLQFIIDAGAQREGRSIL